jgi:DNA repair exonuclease SbcCD ATPase subunit
MSVKDPAFEALEILSTAITSARQASNQTTGKARKALRALARSLERVLDTGGPCPECGEWHPGEPDHEEVYGLIETDPDPESGQIVSHQ